MNLVEFIDLRKKVGECRGKYFESRGDREEKEYVDKIKNILEDITPNEYLTIETYFEKLAEFELKTSKKYEHKILRDYQKLEALKEFLGEDYEVPLQIYEYIENKLKPEIGEKTYQNIYWHHDDIRNNKGLQEIVVSEIIKADELKNKNEQKYSPKLLARIMSDKELEEFKEKGLVEPYTYEGKRDWDDYNNNGRENYYTFMCMSNREEILLNTTSIVPYISKKFRESDENLNIVFFESNNISEDMVYSSNYEGYIIVDEYDGPGIYGIDSGIEVAVPYYSNKNFKLVNSYKTNSENIKKDFVISIIKLKLLNYDKTDKETSILYNDFINWLEERNLLEKINNDYMFDDWFSSYYSEKMEEEECNRYFHEVLNIAREDISKELENCMRICKDKFKLRNQYVMISLEAEALQKLENWEFERGGYMYDEYEYDENEYDEDEYDEDDKQERKTITKKEIEMTVKQEPLLDRQKAKEYLTEELHRETEENSL